MKRKFKLGLLSVLTLCMLFSLPVLAKDSEVEELTVQEISEILKDVEPVEVATGVYLRDSGEYSIYDVDVSKIEFVESSVSDTSKDTFVLDNAPLLRDWDLSTDYVGSFQGAFRVFSRVYFSGYGELYAKFTEINCPSDSTWKASLFAGTKEATCSEWYSSSKTSASVRFYNLDTSTSYRVAFEKTDNNSKASGVMRISKN